MGKFILIVEDEKPIADILTFNLEKEGFAVKAAYDGETGLEIARMQNPELILLDVMLPKMDGFEVCKKARETSAAPIIMLTARDEELDKVLGLELGADDYITKPFSIRELMARVKANMRRTSFPEASKGAAAEANAVVKSGVFEIDAVRYEARKNGVSLDLTLREFELLKYLLVQPNRVFSREALLSKVWGYEFYGDVRTVDVTVRRLREKVEENSADPMYVLTKRGVGYYFNKPEERAE
jgi:two-component system response regulator VicR